MFADIERPLFSKSLDQPLTYKCIYQRDTLIFLPLVILGNEILKVIREFSINDLPLLRDFINDDQ